MDLSIQNWTIPVKDEFQKVEIIASAGFKYADWDLQRFYSHSPLKNESDEDTISYYTSLKQACDKVGLTIYSTHTVFPTEPVKDSKEDIFKRIEKCFLATNLLGAKYTVVHPMIPKYWEGEENKDIRISENIKFYNEITPLAEKYNVVICIENLYGSMQSYGIYNDTTCHNSEEMLAIINGVEKREYFGFCYDVGHANLTLKQNHPQMILELGKDIKVLHLHDNNSKLDLHQLPGLGGIKWKEVIKNLKQVGFTGAYNFEVAPNCMLNFNKVKKLSKIYNKLDKLINQDN